LDRRHVEPGVRVHRPDHDRDFAKLDLLEVPQDALAALLIGRLLDLNRPVADGEPIHEPALNAAEDLVAVRAIDHLELRVEAVRGLARLDQLPDDCAHAAVIVLVEQRDYAPAAAPMVERSLERAAMDNVAAQV